MKSILIDYLTNHSKLSPSEITDIVSHFTERKLDKNESWISTGEISSKIGFVSEGILRLYNEVDAEEVTLQFIFENSFFASLTSLVYQMPSRWSIQAITPCTIVEIEREAHFALIDKYKHWLEIDNVQLMMAYTSLENRMYNQLHLDAEQRLQQLLNEHPAIFNQVPLKYIASSIGITPETLSRLRKKLVIVIT